MERQILIKSDITDALKRLGLKHGDNVIVHTSLSSLGFVCGGAQTVIEALLDCDGNDGTVMMPTQSWKNLDPSTGVHWQEPSEWWDIIRANWPAYDKNITPTNTMGAVAEMFRSYPNTLRSDHPARSFAANGKNALYLTQNHGLSDIFGDGSPLGKLYELDGYVLLLGVGYDKNTSLHLADARANYPSKHNVTEHSAITVNGKREWTAYETLYVDGEDFVKIGEEFEKHCRVAQAAVGNAVARYMRQRELVDFAVDWISENRL